ncbi:hypothetical protein [Streptomyces shenzhenensis]|uniref:Transcriptional regulator n=1 Tax=Streptomyces shenzhenensis TaxID=943815 RepID=A0A3M0HU73_9ACTN|nr:hypothetical protein [Streptomyces shenzhenensis]RMB79638.1 hypothetical protein CTZ28_44300 [Streptomyces shenzhenensis]
MNDLDTLSARRTVRRAARRLAEDAPKLAVGSADAYRTGLATRAAELRRAVLAAWLTGVPEHVIAADGGLSPAVVHAWISAGAPPTDRAGGPG